MKRNGDWIQVYSGKQFWPCDPTPEEIDIGDIAHALSLTCRFTGHCESFYSVAQHCVLCSRIVPKEDSKWGLLHDASEAYIADVSRPVKPFLENYQALEFKLMYAVSKRFGLPWPIPQSIHDADNVLVCTEARDLLRPAPASWGEWSEGIELLPITVMPLQPRAAEQQFLARFWELFPERITL
jgi:uncharacterized protein